MPREKVILDESYTIASTGLLPAVTNSLRRQDFQKGERRKGAASPVNKNVVVLCLFRHACKKEGTEANKECFQSYSTPEH